MNAVDFPKIIIRTPPEIKEWLYARAKANNRSATGELINILQAERKRNSSEVAND